MKAILTLVSLSIILISCNSSKNGKYVIYSVEVQSYSDDSVGTYLKNSLQGNYYDISFQDKFVTVRSLKNKEDMILAKQNGNNENPVYALYYEKNGARFNVSLKQKNDITIKVELSIPKEKSIVMPVQLGESDWFKRKSGSVICYLSKVEQ